MSNTGTLEKGATTGNSTMLAGTNPPVSVFQGTNSVMGSGLATAVTGTSRTVGGVSEVRYQVCYDSSTLSQTLDITQSANVGFGLFGFSEKTQFLKKTRQTTYSVNLVVYARHVIGTEIADNWRLADGVTPQKTTEEMLDFFRSYGDSFVASLTRGAEYYAVYTFYAQTEEEQRTLKTEMAANGIFEGGSFGAGFQSSIDNFVKKTSVRVSMDQMISGLRNPTFPAADKIVDYALKFPSIEPDSPAIIRCQATGYEHVKGFGPYQPIATNRAYFIGNGMTPGLYPDLLAITDLYNTLTWLQKTYSSYGGYSDATVVKVLGEATNDLNAVNDQVARYNGDPLAGFTKPALTSLTHGTPQL